MSRTLRFLWTALLVALGALRRNVLRGTLTAFGILIGVAAVTIVVGLGEGATKAVSGRIDSLGENALIVIPEETQQSGVRDQKTPLLTEGDAAALAREANGVTAAAGLLMGFSQVEWSDSNTTVQVIGTTRDFFKVRAWKVKSGSLWTAGAENIGEKVVLVGSTVKDELFHGEDPVGHTVRIGRYPFTVIGVLAEKGQTPFGQDQDNVICMPARTMRARLQPTRPGQVSRILLSAASPGLSARVKREATAILRQRHHIEEGAESDFRIRSQADFRKAQQAIMGVLSMLLLGIAAVSLVVGGIGVMNIMLVSVAERTREIGIRMAIGAREADIMLQFLVEAVVLAVLGGIAGALLATGAIAALAHALGWSMAVSPRALAVALLTSTVVGVVFGFVPARRAARLDPIQALRRE